MAKLVKFFLYFVAAVVGLFVIAGVALTVFFDPNDFRDTISTQVRNQTGREFTIEGDLSLSVFPWLAVEIGRTTMGNAEGFGDDAFVSFDSARLSVKLMPLVIRQEIAVGTATLDGFEANLAVNGSGVTNWDDLAKAESAPAETASGDARGGAAIDIANFRLSDARINYSDAASGSQYTITGLSVATGRITPGEPFDIDAGFEFSAQPGELGGDLQFAANIALDDTLQQVAINGMSIAGTLRGVVEQPTEFNLESRSIALDTAAGRVSPGEIDLGVLGLSMSADVQPFSYANGDDIVAALRVAEFSLKDLMTTLNIEAPVTADPNALRRLSFEANATIGAEAISLAAMTLVMDDTTLSGDLAVPLTESGALVFDLVADSITIDNYMAPAADETAAADDEAADVEIPVDLIRSLKANGTVKMNEAFLGPVTFTNMTLGVDGSGDKLRLYPITAEFFDGAYSGDVRIDVTGDLPALAVNERISDVNLSSMARALYETDKISGMINGSFVLAGSGATLSAISSDLDGTLSFELNDGAWEGTDVWHQLRSARAIYKREAPPEPRLPPRTEFTSIRATGPVTDGVFQNDDLLAQMPYLRVTGAGSIDLGAREVDYSVQARVLEKPEFMSNASDDELADFTEALIPIRITGPLASPSFRPDIEAMFRAEVEQAIEEKTDELKQDLLNRLLNDGDEEEGAAGEGADTQQEEEKDVEDELKDRLKDLFPR